MKMIFNKPEEKQILETFREQVKDLKQDDNTLRRYLQARNYDPIKAEEMLRKSIEWRTTNKLDDALKWKISDTVANFFPIEYPGVDRQNRAVMYIPLGAWPIREKVEAGHKDEMTLYMYVCLERLVQEIKKSGDQFTLIVDMHDSKYWKFAHYDTLQIMFKLFRDFEANYPERLAEAWVINAPFYIMYTWSLIKPLLTGTTLSKITFVGSNEDKYMPLFLERMPATSIPTRLRKFIKQ